ncbi:Ugo1p [Sugiyamaella lignohabitans]|uniref:Ugo1p n=1 Tax=Sugiyamaella lignohabitans TaxID=796027 RepID=A0A167F7R7_9ASCO|nr:Ugo1p [Sugiyamaella lignohabitans]ANB14918.1 Ugo1p [Sugiyamaella lignohabitans]
MSNGSSSLRPYYDPETFRSPVKGHNGLTIVHGTTVRDSLSNQGAHTAVSAPSPGSSSSSASGSGGFVYLDAGDGLNAIAMSLTRLYAKTLVSQPFEISRLLLQVGDWTDVQQSRSSGAKSRDGLNNSNGDDQTSSGNRNCSDDEEEDDDEDEDEDDEINYFTAVSGDYRLQEMRKKIKQEKRAATQESPDGDGIPSGARPGTSSSPPRIKPNSKAYTEVIRPSTIRIFDIMSALNEKDGVKGLWRGLQTTFIFDALTSMVEAWLSGFLSSISGIPDPQFVEVLHSPNPLLSLGTAVTAAVLTSVILSPIDTIRTRFAVSTFSTGPRSFRASIISLKSYTSPWLVLIPTILQSGLTSVIHLSTPYLLYTKFGIDMFSSPSLYSAMSLVSSIMELSVRLWNGYDATELATPEAFEADPSLVWQFYSYRRRAALKAKPNAGHYALAELARRQGPNKFLTLTQNVDGLSVRAKHPPEGLLHLHGDLFTLQCTSFTCTYKEEGNFQDPLTPALRESINQFDKKLSGETSNDSNNDINANDEGASDEGNGHDTIKHIPISDLPICPLCRVGLLRPGVVWFGEPLPLRVMTRADDFITSDEVDLILVVGTSGTVWPAAGYVEQVVMNGGKVAIFNIDPPDMTDKDFDGWIFTGDATHWLPKALEPLVGKIRVPSR